MSPRTSPKLGQVLTLYGILPWSLAHLFHSWNHLDSLWRVQLVLPCQVSQYVAQQAVSICPHRYPLTPEWQGAIVVECFAKGRMWYDRDYKSVHYRPHSNPVFYFCPSRSLFNTSPKKFLDSTVLQGGKLHSFEYICSVFVFFFYAACSVDPLYSLAMRPQCWWGPKASPNANSAPNGRDESMVRRRVSQLWKWAKSVREELPYYPAEQGKPKNGN